MKQIALTKGKFAIVDDEDFEYLNQWKWCIDNKYASRNEWLKKEKKYKLVYMHRLINKTPKGFVTDHINRNKLDNRRYNLRTASKSLNVFNKDVRKDNKCGYTGIDFYERVKKWRARITFNKRDVSLGYYFDLEDAILARRTAEQFYEK